MHLIRFIHIYIYKKIFWKGHPDFFVTILAVYFITFIHIFTRVYFEKIIVTILAVYFIRFIHIFTRVYFGKIIETILAVYFI